MRYVPGIVLMLIGIAAIMIPFGANTNYRSSWSLLDLLLLFGPTLFFMGISMTILSFFPGARVFSPRTILLTGLLMLVVGIFPWIYTPYFFNGRSNEGSGMMGTLIFLMVGIPGIILTILGLLMGGINSD